MNVDPIKILMAEDDIDDQILVKRAFRAAHTLNDLACVNNGEELLQYLRRQGTFSDATCPDLLLLDLNMPKKDGREALTEIRDDPQLRHIPVIVLTTSDADEDILRSYQLGANSYIKKPVTFEKMVEVVQTLRQYWVGIVKLPPNGDRKHI